MAENNRNWGNQSNQTNQDWERNRNRLNQDDEARNRENYSSYGDVNYGSDYNQNQGMRGGYGRSDYGGAYSSDYGSQYGSGYRESDYGNRSGMQGEGDWQNSGSGYGNQSGSSNQWRRSNMGSAGMYGGDFGRDYEERRDTNLGSQYGSGSGSNYGSAYGRSNYGSSMGTSGGYRDDYNRGDRREDSNRGKWGSMQNRDYMSSRDDRDRDWWDRTRDEVSSWFGDDDAERRRRMDEQRTGTHRGKGPKDYHRSPDRIKEDVCDRLSDDDRLDASHIEVQIQGDEVILSGSVESREDKRRAEDLAESISGVRNVENRIRVGRGDETTIGSASGTQTIGSQITSSERSKNK